MKLTKKGYLTAAIILWILCYVIYRKYVFFRIVNTSTKLSMILFLLFLIVPSLICIIADFRNKNFKVLLCVQITSLGIFTTISYYIWEPDFIRIFVIATALILLIAIFMKVKCRIKRYDRIGVYLSIAAYFSSYSLIYGAIEKSFSDTLKYREQNTVTVRISSTDPFEKHIDDLMKFKEQNWTMLDIHEKMDLIQLLADLEADKLGFQETPQLSYSPYEDRHHGSHYSNNVVLNIYDLSSTDSKIVLEALFHEMYHEYELKLIELYKNSDEQYRKLYAFRNVPKYIKEFENYIKFEDDMYGYYNQQTEKDAREYSREEIEYINELIYKEENQMDIDEVFDKLFSNEE